MAPGSSSKQRDYDFLFKLVLIGDSGVGKSCLLLRFAVRAALQYIFKLSKQKHFVRLACVCVSSSIWRKSCLQHYFYFYVIC